MGWGHSPSPNFIPLPDNGGKVLDEEKRSPEQGSFWACFPTCRLCKERDPSPGIKGLWKSLVLKMYIAHFPFRSFPKRHLSILTPLGLKSLLGPSSSEGKVNNKGERGPLSPCTPSENKHLALSHLPPLLHPHHHGLRSSTHLA